MEEDLTFLPKASQRIIRREEGDGRAPEALSPRGSAESHRPVNATVKMWSFCKEYKRWKTERSRQKRRKKRLVIEIYLLAVLDAVCHLTLL